MERARFGRRLASVALSLVWLVAACGSPGDGAPGDREGHQETQRQTPSTAREAPLDTRDCVDPDPASEATVTLRSDVAPNMGSLQVPLPKGWCELRSEKSIADDGLPLVEVDLTGPPQPGRLDGRGNGEIGLIAMTHEGVPDRVLPLLELLPPLEGDWSEWTPVDIGGPDAVERALQDGIVDQRFIAFVLDNWLVGLVATDTSPELLRDLAAGIAVRPS